MLKGKNAVITGGSRGIGKAIALEFAKNGADIAIIATRESKASDETLKERESFGVTTRLYYCDIRDADQVESAVQEIIADFGTIDILVNNAGITKDNLLPSLGIMDIDNVIDVNLKGCMFVTRSFIRNFVRHR